MFWCVLRHLDNQVSCPFGIDLTEFIPCFLSALSTAKITDAEEERIN